MPIVTVDTNVKSVEPTVAKTISEHVAKCLKKPEAYVMVQLNPGKTMCFSGKTDPCALMQIRSIGAISKESNSAAAVVLTKVLSEQLGVEPSRIFIEFFDVKGENLSLDGATR
uniref:L-dopachrome isomerase n=1 Tax=Steinernema glaseri TaxID=37863 RepID=A0A1I7YUU6_9BILA